MIENLIAFVERTGGTAVPLLLPQDAALCALWCGHQQDAARRGAVRQIVDAWREGWTPPATPTLGRRHQWLLRGLIDELQGGNHQTMPLEAAAFLLEVLELAAAPAIAPHAARIIEILEPSRAILAQRMANPSKPLDPASLRSRQHYLSTADLSAAPAKETRLLAGIELPCRGPVITVKTHVRVLGDVPDLCTVVVEGPHCCAVDGYVLGRILSRLHCEVRGNIAGAAIVLEGGVRARSIINNARVISKMGHVHCVSIQGPRLVFAGRSITVAEGTMLGTCIARTIRVGQDVKGGVLHIAEQGEARRFLHLGSTPLEIYLRRELTCEDFGEVTGAELRRLLSDAFHLRRAAHNYGLLAAAAAREVEHAAQALLMYLFGGGEAHKKLEDYLHTQRRLDIVNRILDNMSMVLERARDGLRGRSDDRPGENPDAGLGEILEDGEVDPDLLQESDAAGALQRRLDSAALDQRQTRLILDQARERIAKLSVERESLQGLLAQKEKSIQSLEKYEKVLAQGAAGAETKLQVLEQILPAIRKQPENSPLAMRLRAPFASMALGAMDRKRRHIRDYVARQSAYLNDFRAVSERLGREFQVEVLEQVEDGNHCARVTGVFEAGIRVYLDDPPVPGSELPAECVVDTDGDDAVRTYMRASGRSKFHNRI